MILKVFFNAAVVTVIFLKTLSAYKYGVVIRHEAVFSPCDFQNVKYIDEYVDMSNLNFEMFMNGSVYVHGYIVLIKDFGLKDNPYSVQAFKKSRGNWVDTIYNMRGADICKGVFNSLELWSAYTKDIPEEDRTCPFAKGAKFYFNTLTDITIDVMDPRAAGDYKVQTLIQISEAKEMVCQNILLEVYRKKLVTL